MTSTIEKPAGFDAYWREVTDELASYPSSPEVEPISMRSTDFAAMYGVRLTSIGPYRIFAYLSIPHGEGPFPAIYYPAKYGSVVEPVPQGAANLNRSRFITCSVSVRGQRNSNQPFAADFPGMLTHNIGGKSRYVFRGVVADCLRALEFLFDRPELDPTRVVVVGNDMALITASLGQGITHVVTTPALFFDTAALAPNTSSYPLQEVNDVLRLHPETAPAVSETLSHFNPRWFAPQVEANVLILTDSTGGLLDRSALRPLIDALPGEVTVQESLNSSYKDGLFTEKWVAEQCGFDRAIVPEHWR